MDNAAIVASMATNLNPVGADRIDNNELITVLTAMLNEEMTVDGVLTNNLLFLAKKGTYYSSVISTPSVTLNPTGDVVGWELVFRHNAASISLAATGATLTFLNPESYVPSSTNYIRAKVLDTGQVIAEVMAPNRVGVVGSTDTQISAGNTYVLGKIATRQFLAVAIVPTGSNGVSVSLGDNQNAVNGTIIHLNDETGQIAFKYGGGNAALFDLLNKQITLSALASSEPDGTPIKPLGVTASGQLVKAHSVFKYQGEWDDLTALEAGIDTPAENWFAFLKDIRDFAWCEVAGTWTTLSLDAYDILPATLALLEAEANWGHDNVYSGSAIDAADLVEGKRAIHSTEPDVYFECLPGSPNYWVRKGNRIPATLKYALGAPDVDATADTAVPKDTDYLEADFILIGAEGNAGAVNPTGSGAVLDIHAGGSTVFAGTKVEIAAAAATGSQAVTAVELAKGTKIEVFVDAIGSTDAGQGYRVALKGFWKF